MITSRNKIEILGVELQLRSAYKQFRTTSGTPLTSLGCTPGLCYARSNEDEPGGDDTRSVTSREWTHHENSKGSRSHQQLYMHVRQGVRCCQEHAKTFHILSGDNKKKENKCQDIFTSSGTLCDNE